MHADRRAFSLDLAHHRAELVLYYRKSQSYELIVGGIPQSRVSLAYPELLDYPYVRHIARMLDAAAPAGEPLRTVHLGAGALTLPRYVAATRPGSPQIVVEYERALGEAVLQALPLPEGADVTMLWGDARQLAASPPADVGWDNIPFTIVDLWDAARVSAHVSSSEFYALVAKRMSPGGVLAVNLLDGGAFEYARGQAATLAALFGNVAVVLDTRPYGHPPVDNVVVFASDSSLAVAEHPDLLDDNDNDEDDPAGPRPTVLSGAELTRWVDEAAPVTDATAVDSPDPYDPRFPA
ncbi:spermidine synthase [Herbiconiux sp. UC225_62]|uniref:spermidine synthase n=1 Tax=Herbiconiux sp. UC225_62 TaxID=3350168 RepID=UPI0036D2386E